MSRPLHWILLTGCLGLCALFTPLAWQSVAACEVPEDCRGMVGAGEEAPPSVPHLGGLETSEGPATSPG